MVVFRNPPKQLVLEQKRFRGKINIQKPRKPHYTRQMVDDFLTPFYKNPNLGKPLVELCLNATESRAKEKEVNPHRLLVEKLCLDWFKKSKMVAFLHQNSMKAEEQFEMKVPLFKANMHYKAFNKQIIGNALRDTPYEAACRFSLSSNSIIFSPETNVKKLTKIIRRFPQVVLMGGILDGKLLHLEDFLKYGQLDLTSARVGLVHMLRNAGGNNLNRQLTHHQTTLVSRLKQIGANETPADKTEGEGEPVPA